MPKPTSEHQNRIWIELEKPPKKMASAETHLLGHARAKLANNLIDRLMEPSERNPTKTHVFWSERDYAYCFMSGGWGSYVVAEDNGHWYSLDYFGRPLTE
jgi:hypothetical protein